MITRRELSALVIAFVLTLPAVTTRLYASDEVQYFAWLRSAAFDRDADFDNEYRYFYATPAFHNDGFRDTFLDDEKRNEAGRRLNHAPVGSALLWAPFYGVGHVVAHLTGAPADGYSQPYVAAVAYGSAVYGFLALLLTISIVRQIVGRGVLATCVIFIGTPVLFYVYVAPPMSHANSAFAVALFLWVWLKVRTRWSVAGMVALGASGALLAMVREQDVTFVAGPALDYLRTMALGRVRVIDLMAAIAAAAAAYVVTYLPQWVAYIALTGHAGPAEYVSRKMFWSSPYGLLVLFSPEHGFFAWTPLAMVAIAGLLALALGRVPSRVPDAKWLGLIALVLIGLQAYVSGAVASWTAAGGFGQRRFVSVTPLLALGLAALFAMPALQANSLRRGIAVVLVGLCVWWNLGLMAQFGANTMDRQRLTLAANARTTFMVLPIEGPSLAWRYLTDRQSFYQRH